jgi:hypothetical protein
MTTIKEGTYLKVNMNEGDDISEDDLREQEQILIRFQQISDLLSFVEFKNKDEAQSSYQALQITTLISRDRYSKIHSTYIID